MSQLHRQTSALQPRAAGVTRRDPDNALRKGIAYPEKRTLVQRQERRAFPAVIRIMQSELANREPVPIDAQLGVLVDNPAGISDRDSSVRNPKRDPPGHCQQCHRFIPA